MKNLILFICSFLLAAMTLAQTPVISVNPDSITENLYTGGSVIRNLTISNTGTADLECTVFVEPTDSSTMGNKAVQFDGINDYIAVMSSQSLQLSSQLTIEAWIRFEVGGTEHPALLWKGTQTSDYDIFMDSTIANRHIGLNLRNVGSIMSNAVLSAGIWYHVAFTYDGTAIQLYINGILDHTQADTGTIAVTPSNLYLGFRCFSNSGFYKGAIDNLRIWNEARTQDEILQTLNHEISGQEPGLVACWEFNEGSGSVANDASNYHNKGFLKDGTAWINSAAPILNWLYADPVSMTIGAGEASSLEVTLYATGLNGGAYNGQVAIHNNDPANPLLEVPVQMNLTPSANIHLSVTQLDFGKVLVGTVKILPFNVSNTGYYTLYISSMTCPNSDYVIPPLIDTILQLGSATINVTYTPSAWGSDDTVLTIQSNDHFSPSVNLPLSG